MGIYISILFHLEYIIISEFITLIKQLVLRLTAFFAFHVKSFLNLGL